MKTASQRGVSLIEMMIAMGLGLLLVTGVTALYLSNKNAFRRTEQLSSIQQGVRTAFDYISDDARAVGLMGCQSGRAGGFVNNLSTGSVETNYGLGIEGFDAATTPAYPLTAATSAGTNWTANTATDKTVATVPIALAGGSLTLGSDVLVLRRVAGAPLRLAADTVSAGTTVTAELLTSNGETCQDGSTAKKSGFCTGSHAVVTTCQNSRVFSVGSLTSSTNVVLTMASGQTLGGDPLYRTGATAGTNPAEVFPLQTVLYYIRTSSSGTSTSLYRRILNGNLTSSDADQEIVEDVESMQVRYGVDTATTNADGTPDGTVDAYVTANAVGTWNSVTSVRISLLMRNSTPVDGDLASTVSGKTYSVGGVTVSPPTTGRQYTRQVFTTTIALRNKVAY